ncbi:hypothetical protein RB195_011290 [Necator americanus]|uniref:Uncharacterized protein n=1 Tax=Necator americanus TaxID=51031 RepID=A0ABR1D1R7_NECAM
MPQRRSLHGNWCGIPADDTWKIATSCNALENGESKSSSLLWSYIETGRSPCSTSSEEFVGFELEEATWPKTEVLDSGGERGPEDRQFRRDVRFRRIWISDEWIDSVQAHAVDREGWGELCSRTAHLGEDAGNRLMR